MLLISSSVSASYRSAKMRTASTSHHQICLLLSTFPLVSIDKLSLLPPAANSFNCVLGPPCPLIFWHSLTLQYLIAHLLHRFSFFFPTGSFSLAYKHGAIVSIFKRKTFPLCSLSATTLFLCSPWQYNSLKKVPRLTVSIFPLSFFLIHVL